MNPANGTRPGGPSPILGGQRGELYIDLKEEIAAGQSAAPLLERRR
jgi:hypothetical protein